MPDYEFALPWPPSVNHVWRRVGSKTLLSAEGRKYREAVWKHCLVVRIAGKRLEGRLSVKILVNPPDRRRRDIDNLAKVPLDALTHAAVWIDDSQIDELYIRRDEIKKGGFITIQITELQPGARNA